MSKEADYLLWLDLETAGSNVVAGDPILEVATILTDRDLEVLGTFEAVVWPEQWDRDDRDTRRLPTTIDQFVVKMHNENGLWNDCARDGRPLHVVESELILRLSMNRGNSGKFVLAGSGVSHFDRRFIDYQMPRLAKWLRYYSIDVGVLRRSLELIGCSDLIPPMNEQKTHRAMDDVKLHLDEMQHYKKELRALMDGWCGDCQ
jgi:oligoribonuclease (3'-5' exoribonuclease)